MNPLVAHALTPSRHDFPPIDIALLQTLFDLAADIAFFVKDADGRYLAVNESLVLRLGLKRKADVLGKRACEIFPGEFGMIPSEQDDRVLRTGKPLIEYLELQLYRPSVPVWCLTTKLPICDVERKVIGLIGFSRDLRAPVERRKIPPEFAAALNEFEQNLAVQVTPAWFAKRAKLSLEQVARLTKSLFDLTPTQLISKTRIAAASRMLRQSDQSVGEIAHACGFFDHSAFTRAFRLATGVTPSQFRSQVE